MTPTDRAHDVLKTQRQPLDNILHPRSIAVVGATEKAGSVGRSVLWNLVSNPFGGTVYPVNPQRPSVMGIRAYPSVAALPEVPDLAVIVTPATSVPGIISQCVDVGVRGAIVISAGFKETGAPGVELERQVLEQARRGRMRIIGPNCLGVMCPVSGLNATFAASMARPGSVAFISQSGALCTAILDWSLRENVGFSAFISIGSMLDVDWGDLIDYLGNDPHTRSIVLYMESIGDARSFLSAAREVALAKPVILIKAGRSAAAAQAAASHTGALAGSDAVLDAACRRTGVLRVNQIEELFLMSEVLAKQPRPQGPRLTLITNAGGPGVLATDELIANGGKMAEISPATIQALNAFLPAAWSHNNPIDVLGDADADRYLKTLQTAASDPNSDGLLVILTPQAMTDSTRTADALKAYAQNPAKPVLASWMGGQSVSAGREILTQAGIPTLPYPDTAARLFCYMWKYSYNLQGIYETPSLADDPDTGPDRAAVQAILDEVRRDQRTILTEVESKELLAAYGLPTVKTHVAQTEDEAVDLAHRIEYPVVLKIHSKTITHKTDVGGVHLNLADDQAVRRAFRSMSTSVKAKFGVEAFGGVAVQPMVKLEGYELILGSSVDAQFGPVLLFGSGGQLVEVYEDRALALPPLNTTLARRLMEQTHVFQALKGVRGRQPVDMAELERLIVRFSQLVVEQPRIREIDINPLVVSPQRIVALDARIILHDASISDTQLPRSAIRPYPKQYTWSFTTHKNVLATIRPIRPEDEPQMVQFHQGLSERSVYMRFFQALNLSARVSHDRLRRRCFIDYDREMALVAETRDTASGGGRAIHAVARLSRIHGTPDAEFAVIVADLWQHQGLGTELLRRLVEIGRREGVRRITAEILPENLEMQRTVEKVGFHLRHDTENRIVYAELELQPAETATTV